MKSDDDATNSSSSNEAATPMNPGDDAPAGTPGTGEDVCPACGGTGKLDGASCGQCAGTGKVNVGVGGG